MVGKYLLYVVSIYLHRLLACYVSVLTFSTCLIRVLSTLVDSIFIISLNLFIKVTLVLLIQIHVYLQRECRISE